jgi:hypothetical protein
MPLEPLKNISTKNLTISRLPPRSILLFLLTFLAAASSTFGTVRYVNASSANPAPPYINWASAAKTIQQAVDMAEAGDEILVTNGVYATGGLEYGMSANRVTVDKTLTVRSV